MSGLNGTPGERVYSKRVPRVRIPTSPPFASLISKKNRRSGRAVECGGLENR